MTADELRALAAQLDSIRTHAISAAASLRERADLIEAAEMVQSRPSRPATFLERRQQLRDAQQLPPNPPTERA